MKNSPLPVIEKLDDVLSILSAGAEAKIYNSVPIELQDIDEISEFLKNSKPKSLEIHNHLLTLILNKLVEDNYIEKVGVRYRVTFNGYIYSINGGYQNEIVINQNLDKLKTAQSQMVKYSFWVNVIIAIGTTVAAFYYLLEILNHFYCIYPSLH